MVANTLRLWAAVRPTFAAAHPLQGLQTTAQTNNQGAMSMDSLEFAQLMDKNDSLAKYRAEFHIPSVQAIATFDLSPDAKFSAPLHERATESALYFTGNSLGLPTKKAEAYVLEDLQKWRTMGVTGHFAGKNQWLTIDDLVTEKMAKVVGAKPIEVAMMNTLSANLHLGMVSFYAPTKDKFKILIESGPFPSDWYAVESQVKFHGFDPKEALVFLSPRAGEYTLRTEDIMKAMDDTKVAMVMLPGVQFVTGQYFDIPTITAEAHKRGIVAGWDLAHGAGNLPLKLHDWNVDFAVWCSYKYLCSGAGGIGGFFVHEKHAHRKDLNRFAGWWGHNLNSRFGMQEPFNPIPGAYGYRLSNPCTFPILTTLATLELYDEAGMDNFRAKSLNLTAYLEYLVKLHLPKLVIITPADHERRGCQLSLSLVENYKNVNGRELEHALYRQGVVVDFRGQIIRAAPHPLFNSFEDVFRMVHTFKTVLEQFNK